MADLHSKALRMSTVSGTRKLSLDHVGVDALGNLCTIVKSLNIDPLTDKQKENARLVSDNASTMQKLNVMPSSMHLMGKVTGELTISDTEETDADKSNADDFISSDKKPGKYAEMVTGIELLSCDKHRGSDLTQVDADMMRQAGGQKAGALDDIVNWSKNILNGSFVGIPLRSTMQYSELQVNPSSGTNVIESMNENQPYYITTNSMLNGTEPQFYSNENKEKSSAYGADMVAANIYIDTDTWDNNFSDRIGYFTKKDAGLFYNRVQGIGDINLQRFGESILQHPLQEIGPIFRGDVLTVKSFIEISPFRPSQFSIMFK